MTVTDTSTTTTDPTTSEPRRITPRVAARLVPGTTTRVSVEAGEHAFTIDEPEGLGGTDAGATPVDHLLAALGACQVITIRAWADKLDLALEDVAVELHGDLDLRGFLGLADVRPGFEGIEVAVRLSGPEGWERYAELIDAVDEHCPVLDNLRSVVPVTSTLTLA